MVASFPTTEAVQLDVTVCGLVVVSVDPEDEPEDVPEEEAEMVADEDAVDEVVIPNWAAVTLLPTQV
jgi:hypothetical protein